MQRLFNGEKKKYRIGKFRKAYKEKHGVLQNEQS